MSGKVSDGHKTYAIIHQEELDKFYETVGSCTCTVLIVPTGYRLTATAEDFALP